MNYELHPLCTLFPRISGDEFGALVADIKANGLQSPIVIHDGMILDGGNRYRACIEAGVEPEFREFDGGSIVAFVLSANLHRRHMSAGQQAAIVSSAQDWAKAQGRGGDRKSSDQSATLHFDSVEKRAAESGASIRTQKMADKVAKASPDLAKQVAHGEISLPAAVKQVSGKPEKKTFAPELPPEVADCSADEYELQEAQDAIRELVEENTALRDRLAVEQMDVSDEGKLEAAQIIEELRTKVRHLEDELLAVKSSRNNFQLENAQLKKQIARMQRQEQRAA